MNVMKLVVTGGSLAERRRQNTSLGKPPMMIDNRFDGNLKFEFVTFINHIWDYIPQLIVD